MAEVMAAPKRDNSKGQRRVAVAKKADPGSRGRKTTVLKGPGNARVTPKVVEGGAGGAAAIAARVAAALLKKKAADRASKEAVNAAKKAKEAREQAAKAKEAAKEAADKSRPSPKNQAVKKQNAAADTYKSKMAKTPAGRANAEKKSKEMKNVWKKAKGYNKSVAGAAAGGTAAGYVIGSGDDKKEPPNQKNIAAKKLKKKGK